MKKNKAYVEEMPCKLLIERGMSKDEVNILRGMSRNSTDESYYYVNPKVSRERYIECIGAVVFGCD